jgi:iron(III) transport system ATP-binding protein
MTGLVLERVTVAHGRRAVVHDVSLTVAPGELLAVLGPSGCGKTTLLLAIAGLLPVGAGRIAAGARELSSPTRTVPPERRGIGWVPQDAALFPHLTVAGNVAFGLRRTVRDRRARRERAEELLGLVGLAGLGGRAAHQLSGGQAQRVALARALATGPAALLLDEPFASLDTRLRVALREEVVALLRRTGTTAVLVTHDQEEALSLADRVAVLGEGRLRQVGRPEHVYSHPADDWVASFVGDVVEFTGRWRTGQVASPLGDVTARPVGFAPVDGEVVRLLLRPEWVRPRAAGAEGVPGVAARVSAVSYAGHDAVLTCDLTTGVRVRARVPADSLAGIGDDVVLPVPERGLAFPAPPSH